MNFMKKSDLDTEFLSGEEINLCFGFLNFEK